MVERCLWASPWDSVQDFLNGWTDESVSNYLAAYLPWTIDRQVGKYVDIDLWSDDVCTFDISSIDFIRQSD